MTMWPREQCPGFDRLSPNGWRTADEARPASHLSKPSSALLAVLAGRHAHRGLELARERALVAEAAALANAGDAALATQQAHGHFDAQLDQVLLRGDLEYVAEVALQLRQLPGL